ncbi:hypothetical protein DOTSEDRAFT_34084 [Dothistroma septosporum NZE10]|uniref:Uncharacterized protein n=1 Tax=Dothistroma septosporum (strain NZE10 / CBS 128990) TaxID=675120 RepID=N1PRQ6_DOTSN|nr:hypothetical protein DOTSEDRAFT_34084 [Dothistroma septosporum NZE10]
MATILTQALGAEVEGHRWQEVVACLQRLRYNPLILGPFEYLTWEIFKQQRQAGEKIVKSDETVLLFFHWPYNRQVDLIGDVYNDITKIHGEQGRFYPNLREVQEAENKIGDIEALEHIARSAPAAFAYQPTTCLSTNGCTLAKPYVVKRTNSSNSNGVLINPTADDIRELLPCQPNGTPREAQDPAAHGKRWFHQRKIKSLIEFGGFRIFTVTLPYDEGLRGRKGHVFEALHAILVTDHEGAVRYNFGLRVLNRVSDELLDEECCGNKTWKEP